jgi:hypothetical protein
MDGITVTVIVIISTIAVIEAVNIFMKLPCRDCSCGFTALIILDKNDDISRRLDSVIHKVRWTDEELIGKLIIVDNGMSEEQLDICSIENNFLEVAKPNELKNLIFSIEKNNVK